MSFVPLSPSSQQTATPQTTQSFQPLEYWKPPKAVAHHIRAKRSALFAPSNKGERIPHLFEKLGEGRNETVGEKKEMSFATLGSMVNRMKGGTSENITMANSRGSPRVYKSEDTHYHPWWNVKHWGKKSWFIFLGVVVVIIIIIAVAASQVAKANRYPDYSKLTYSLAENYTGTDFFDNFDYFTGYDPSSGFVHYVPAETAKSYNLTYASSTSAVLRVDTSVTKKTEPNASTGRFSVRITSKTQYGLNNLFIFDVKHTPTGCGTWPALWLSDPNNWPTNGEIDVMEAVNVVGSTYNQMTLHTTKDCTMKAKRKETGKVMTTNCLNSTDSNAGCGVNAGNGTFGTGFNSAGGGILAMELRSAGIRMWQFGRKNVPSDLSAGNPDPSTWAEATADFPSTDCDIGTHFRNQSIIANIDLCGSWAGADSVYGKSCPGICTDYVANYNTAFFDSYWEFGAFSVYSGK